jgi:two-component system NtrC family sensor kinase
MKPFIFRLPLFWKFTIAIICIVLIFGTINSVLIYNNVQKALKKETEKRGLFIAKSIANQTASYVLFEDYISLQNAINNIKATDSAISYIFILSKNNVLIVHTFEDEFPLKIISANSVSGNMQFQSQLLKLRGKFNNLILDIAVPIIGGQAGTVRVGIKESSMQKDVKQTVNIFWYMVGVFLIVGIMGALIFANFITKPIKEIQNVAERMDISKIGELPLPKIRIRENLLNRAKMFLRAEDEIDILADKFNNMIDRLETAYQELQKTKNNFIQSEKLATVGTLTAGLAHEINNPIAGLQNCIRRILNDPENLNQNKKYFAMMETAIDKIEKVVGNLLNFSRKQETVFSNLSLEFIIESALVLVSHRLEKLRVSITKNFQKNLPRIYGDKNQLEQVILNLFLNSLDSIEEKIFENPETERTLIISASVKNNFIELQIEDSGKGIPQNIIDKIFDPFFTTKSPGKGTGLGLSVTYNIINAHNGKISFISEEGKRTLALITIPCLIKT